MTDVFTLAVPVEVIVTGFVPDVLQLLPEAPVSPASEMVKVWALTTLVKKTNK